jgi:hypothetical protein
MSRVHCQAAKRAELNERLSKLEKQLKDETEMKLHELSLQWNTVRRKAEDGLKELGPSCAAVAF